MNEWIGGMAMEKMGNALICSSTFIPGNLVLPYESRCDRNRNDGIAIGDQASKAWTQSYSL
jgi:hypothetical protein